MLEIIKYIILGIVQGIAEVFPVSSSGHLIIFSNLLKIDLNNLKIFLMITNFGSFLALLIYFRNDVKDLIINFFSFILKKDKRNDPVVKEGFTYSWKLAISVIPIGIIGLLLEDYIPESLWVVGAGLLLTSLLLFIMYSLRNKEFENQITWKNAMVVGAFQTLAVIPGVSRSGITTVGGLSQKIEIKKILKFSFLSYLLVSIPVSIKGVFDALNSSESINILGYSLAFLFSFIATYITVKILYKVVTMKNLKYFSIYCLFIGIVAIVLNFVL